MMISDVENLSNSIEALSKEIEQIENAPVRLTVLLVRIAGDPCADTTMRLSFLLRQSRADALNRKKEDFLSDISKFKKFAATMQDQKDAVVAAIAEMNATTEAERTHRRTTQTPLLLRKEETLH
jgi:hypothetical protein